MPLKVEIKAFGRIHLGLISLHHSGFRQNGGVGFMVEGLNISVSGSKSQTIDILDKRSKPLGAEELSDLRKTLLDVQRYLRIESGISIEIDGNILTHAGAGSGTAIRLASVEAYLILARREYDKRLAQQLSKRGGTSGVGIHGYFEGGFLLDLGVRARGQSFKPSSSSISPELPLLCKNSVMPNWEFLVALPQNLSCLTREQEQIFFSENLPFGESDTLETAHIALMGLQAAVMEKDFEIFCSALGMLQKSRWKATERAIHGTVLEELDLSLRNLGADAVAMSSLGPLLVVFGQSNVLNAITEQAKSLKIGVVRSLPQNSGRIVRILES